MQGRLPRTNSQQLFRTSHLLDKNVGKCQAGMALFNAIGRPDQSAAFDLTRIFPLLRMWSFVASKALSCF